mmetsp:Transcript_49266/g.114178  ORF Transcript_49266/g.114178 Transcript_49266/m.114178 type:complete len:250 (-) Transcript_49266:49-798(-)
MRPRSSSSVPSRRGGNMACRISGSSRGAVCGGASASVCVLCPSTRARCLRAESGLDGLLVAWRIPSAAPTMWTCTACSDRKELSASARLPLMRWLLRLPEALRLGGDGTKWLAFEDVAEGISSSVWMQISHVGTGCCGSSSESTGFLEAVTGTPSTTARAATIGTTTFLSSVSRGRYLSCRSRTSRTSRRSSTSTGSARKRKYTRVPMATTTHTQQSKLVSSWRQQSDASSGAPTVPASSTVEPVQHPY